MGLIKSATHSAKNVMGEQWKDYFICDSLNSDIIFVAGVKKNTGGSNKKGDPNIITNGSGIVVNEGQAMMIVDNGKIVEFTAEPGEFTYDSSTEPSCFDGGFLKGLGASFDQFKKRFTYGGEAPKTQKVYYINLKELPGRKFGSSTPVVYDDPVYQSISLRYFGSASLKIVDPIKFYVNVCGNVTTSFSIEQYWQSQLKMEFTTSMTEAFARLSLDGVKYSQIPQNQVSIVKNMNDILDEEWIEKRGIEVFSVGLGQISLDPIDKAKVDKIDEMMLLSNSNMAAGRLAAAQANAMENAASNRNGAMAGFMGMNMANTAGGVNANNLFAMNQDSKPSNQNSDNDWKCSCGNIASGNFCGNCGSSKPNNNVWTCSCGKVNSGEFCSDCGKKRPSSNTWTCKCGTTNEGKFCNNCGAPKPN